MGRDFTEQKKFTSNKSLIKYHEWKIAECEDNLKFHQLKLKKAKEKKK